MPTQFALPNNAVPCIGFTLAGKRCTNRTLNQTGRCGRCVGHSETGAPPITPHPDSLPGSTVTQLRRPGRTAVAVPVTERPLPMPYEAVPVRPTSSIKPQRELADLGLDPDDSPEEAGTKLRDVVWLRQDLTKAEGVLTRRLVEMVGPRTDVAISDTQTVTVREGDPRDRYEHDAIWSDISTEAAREPTPLDAAQKVVSLTRARINAGPWRINGLTTNGIRPTDHATIEYLDGRHTELNLTGEDRDRPDRWTNQCEAIATNPDVTPAHLGQIIGSIQSLNKEAAETERELSSWLGSKIPSQEPLTIPGVGTLASHQNSTGYREWDHNTVWSAAEAIIAYDTDHRSSTEEAAQQATRTIRNMTGIRPWKKRSLDPAHHSTIPGTLTALITERP